MSAVVETDWVAATAGLRVAAISGSAVPLETVWLDDENWTLSVPLFPGTNTVALEALDPQGRIVGTDSVRINSAVAVAPASVENLLLTEISYNPVGGDPYEYLEFCNISTVPVKPGSTTCCGSTSIQYACTGSLMFLT